MSKKDHYILGETTKKFVRIYDNRFLIASSLTLEEAKEQKEIYKKTFNKKVKIFKLVEVLDN